MQDLRSETLMQEGRKGRCHKNSPGLFISGFRSDPGVHYLTLCSTQTLGPTGCASRLGSCSPPAAGKGLVEASHFCYLMAHVPFGHYTVKTDHLALVGSSHRYVCDFCKDDLHGLF